MPKSGKSSNGAKPAVKVDDLKPAVDPKGGFNPKEITLDKPVTWKGADGSVRKP